MSGWWNWLWNFFSDGSRADTEFHFSLANLFATDHGDALTGLSLLDFEITGDIEPFSLLGLDDALVLGAGEIEDLILVYNPLIAGRSWNATLTFFTDIGASFGTSGEHFSFTLHGSTAAATAPEPLASSLAGLGIVMLGLIRARRNPTPAVIAGRNQDPSS